MAATRIVLKEMDPPPSPERAFELLARDERPFFLDTGLRLPGFGRFSLLGSRPFLVLESREPGSRCAGAESPRRTRATRSIS